MSDERSDRQTTPAWIPLVGLEEAEGELAEVYRRVGARSGVANIIGVHSLHPAAVERADVQRLRDAGWSDEAVLHACEVVAYFNFVNRTADGLGVTLEEER